MTFIERADAIARKIERFVAGSASSDPFYLTNRTFGQKARLALLIGAPVLAILALVGLALGNYFDPAPSPQKVAAVAKPGNVTGKVLPDLAKTYHSESDTDCDVAEATVGNHTLYGKVRNNSDRTVHAAELIFDITDEEGSQLGAVAVHVENVPPHGMTEFRQPLEQRNGTTALVREIHTR